jgi:hypothetical protein
VDCSGKRIGGNLFRNFKFIGYFDKRMWLGYFERWVDFGDSFSFSFLQLQIFIRRSLKSQIMLPY